MAVVEVQNKTGDTEYLYLPTDICSMNKVKERLQVQDYWESGKSDGAVSDTEKNSGPAGIFTRVRRTVLG